MYKLVAIDLDGTLLDSYGQVSERIKMQFKRQWIWALKLC